MRISAIFFRRINGYGFLSFSSHKSFEQEGEEVGEGVKLTIETDVLIAELDAVSDIGILSLIHISEPTRPY